MTTLGRFISGFGVRWSTVPLIAMPRLLWMAASVARRRARWI